MYRKIITLKRIFEREEISHVLSGVPCIGLVEYDDIDMSYSKAFSSMLADLGIDKSVIKEVVFVGKSALLWKKKSFDALTQLYPDAIIRSVSSAEKCTFLHQTLTIHFLNGLEESHVSVIRSGIANSNFFYSIALYVKTELSGDLFDDIFIEENFADIDLFTDLGKIQFHIPDSKQKVSDYCKDRQKYLQLLLDKGYVEEAFNQCLAEVNNGCEECALCTNYAKDKLCPYFQKQIGDFYKNGIFVPTNESIAHCWYLMAYRQGYYPSALPLADDFVNGKGCEQNILKGAEILKAPADMGNLDCAKKIIEIAQCTKFAILAGHYCLKLANAQTSESAKWTGVVAESFETGEYSFPLDPGKREEWELKAAEGGNFEIIQTIAVRYYEQKNWEKALFWYSRLLEIRESQDLESTIDDITRNSIKDKEMTPREIAEKGNYLFNGWLCDEDKHTDSLYFQIASEEGDAMGKAGLSKYYLECEGDEFESHALDLRCEAAYEGDFDSMFYMLDSALDEEAFDYWGDRLVFSINKGIETKDKYAMLAKARCIDSGWLFDDDKQEAFRLYEYVATVFDYPDAHYQLGLCYIEGRGTARNIIQGYHIVEKAANMGVLEAQWKIGEHYYVYYDYEKSFKWLQKSAQRGHANAQYKLSLLYKYGNYVNKDISMACQWCLKAAEKGIVEAQASIGENLYNGIGMKKDLVEARNWLAKAVDQGNASARFRLAWMCWEGEGGPRDYSRAFDLFKICAENGNSSAMNNLACMYDSGDGVKRDFEEAANWYQKSADNGSSVAMANLGKFYEKGKGVEKSFEKAILLYEKSVAKGYSNAAYYLAELYRKELNDIDKAVAYYEKAISMPHSTSEERRGYDPSIMALANLYYDGEEVNEDNYKAFSLYKKAAEVNITKAFRMLGHCYRYGYGTEIDKTQAIYWYRKAAEKKDQEAIDALKQMGVPYLDSIKDNIDDLPF